MSEISTPRTFLFWCGGGEKVSQSPTTPISNFLATSGAQGTHNHPFLQTV